MQSYHLIYNDERERRKEGGEDRGREGGHVLLKKTEMIKEKHVTKGHIVQYFFIGFPLDVRVCVCDCA